MHRLLVVDDVPIIVDGLTESLLEEESLDIEVYKAYSGIEALEILMKNKIDVVLSDIKMPHMEGIALLQEIKAQWPNCKVIFLTSYNDFDYVQSALSLGAFDYILKTEEQTKIIQVISRAIQTIEEEFTSKKLVEKAELHMKLAIPTLQKEYILALLHGKSKDPFRIEHDFTEIGIPLKSGIPVFLLIARVDSWRNVSMRLEQELLIFALQNIMEECFGDGATFFSVVYEPSKMIWFIQPNKLEASLPENEVWQRTFYFIKGTLETIQNASRDLLRLPVSFVLSEQPGEWSGISEKFDRLLSFLAQEIGLQSEVLLVEGSRLTTSSMLTAIPSKVIGFSLQRKFQLLGYHLENGGEEQFTIVLEEVLSTLASDECNDYLKMEIYHSLASIFMSYMNRHGLTRKVVEQVPVGKLFDSSEIISWMELIEYFRRLAICMFVCQRNDMDKSTHIIVDKVREYVHANIACNISLTCLAEQVHLNASYLSRLYKSVTGISISEYIASVRNEQAKKMLRETGMKIQDIAKAVGYLSGLAFMRFFKKYNDVTPQEYRNGK
ncbi:response regulator [Bacillus sp. 3255]|uniref:response regulator n=1 Tax=Bacillus sp. 3255 TaxID=2817904 RepID=UPI00285BFE06|nr:response regulator [Bacillus sp. 3255]MDR6882501.1 two-component system response regulator YesN [Bacillus sp. 3255]